LQNPVYGKNTNPVIGKRMISLAVIEPGSHDALSDEEKEAVLKEADRLPLHWLSSAYKKQKIFARLPGTTGAAYHSVFLKQIVR